MQTKGGDIMKIDVWTKVALWIIAVMLFLNFFHSIFVSRPALAVGESESIGRYQISSWAAHGGGTTDHNGYYVLDTVRGKVVDKKAEAHTRRE
jgi:hypothetical protein